MISSPPSLRTSLSSLFSLRFRARARLALAAIAIGSLGGGLGCAKLLGIAPGVLTDDGGGDAGAPLVEAAPLDAWVERDSGTGAPDATMVELDAGSDAPSSAAS